jgi:hypothetical protein
MGGPYGSTEGSKREEPLGEVAERWDAAVLKPLSRVDRDRGFEFPSPPL